MKEIYAIIQPNRMNATKEALAEFGIYSLHVFPALGHGQGLVDPKVLKGAEEGVEEAIAMLGTMPPLVPKRSFSIMVPDDREEEVVNAIIKANQTGSHGDGKIFVCPIRETIRVRTGEHGDSALV